MYNNIVMMACKSMLSFCYDPRSITPTYDHNVLLMYTATPYDDDYDYYYYYYYYYHYYYYYYYYYYY